LKGKERLTNWKYKNRSRLSPREMPIIITTGGKKGGGQNISTPGSVGKSFAEARFLDEGFRINDRKKRGANM